MAKIKSGPQIFALVALGFGLFLTQSCTRSEPLHPNASAPPNSNEELPFHSAAAPALGGDHGLDESHDQRDAKVTTSSLPFGSSTHSHTLPSGTLMTVRLDGSLSAAKVHPGDVFTATVAAPLTSRGDTLIPRGTVVSGRVESEQELAGRAGQRPGPGYFRLTLNAINIAGRPVQLQTSSLFARGSVPHSPASSSARPANSGTGGVRVQKGRSLIFRLTAPVTFDDSDSGIASAPATGQRPESPMGKSSK